MYVSNLGNTQTVGENSRKNDMGCLASKWPRGLLPNGKAFDRAPHAQGTKTHVTNDGRQKEKPSFGGAATFWEILLSFATYPHEPQ